MSFLRHGLCAVLLAAAATRLAAAIGELAGATLAVEPCMSTVGGGAMPTAELPSFAVTIRGIAADQLDRKLRGARVPVVARIEDGRVWLDVRTIADEEFAEVVAALRVQ